MRYEDSPIRKRLVELIFRSGLQKKQVALGARKSQQWLSDRVTGHSPIYADELPLLAQGLRVHPCEFFEEATAERVASRVADARGSYQPTGADRGFREYVQAELGFDDEETEAFVRLIALRRRRRGE